MTLQSMLVHQVEIVKPGIKVSRAGDTVYDWGNPTRIASKCWITPSEVRLGAARDSSEGEAAGDRSILLVEMFFQGNVDIANEDRIEWGVRLFEVVGPPRERFTPSGLHHLEVKCKEVLG